MGLNLHFTGGKKMEMTVEAECRKCYKVWFHVRGSSSHVCPDPKCGGQLNCGYEDCVKQEKMRKEKV